MMGTDKEAASIIGTISAIVAAVLVFLQEFGVDITDGQEDAITKLVAILAPLVAALIIRGLVYSKHSVERKVDEAFIDGTQGAGEPPKVL
jgi:multisubunit Na+/H+ antiporter MnhG subunit